MIQKLVKEISSPLIIKSLSWVLVNVFLYSSLFACDIDQHHSILGHYNEADAVYIIQVTHQKTIKEQIVGQYVIDQHIHTIVHKKIKRVNEVTDLNDKSCRRVRLMAPSGSDFMPNKEGRYMVFLKAISPQKKTKGNLFIFYALYDSVKIEQAHHFLDSIRQFNQYHVVELNKYGRDWSSGKLKNGLADGPWVYYGKSGEIQASGTYQMGKKVGKWQYFHSMSDKSYDNTHSFILALKKDSLSNIQIDTNQWNTYRYVISYQNKGETIKDSFFYNHQPVKREVSYKDNQIHGQDILYNENGDTLDYYTYSNGVLHGLFFGMKPLYDHVGYVRIVGQYYNGVKMKEEHLFYDGNGRIYTRRIVVLNGQVL